VDVAAVWILYLICLPWVALCVVARAVFGHHGHGGY
jgi:hypothetical protein